MLPCFSITRNLSPIQIQFCSSRHVWRNPVIDIVEGHYTELITALFEINRAACGIFVPADLSYTKTRWYTTDKQYLYTVRSKRYPPPQHSTWDSSNRAFSLHTALCRTAKIFHFLVYRQTYVVESHILNSVGGRLGKPDVISTELVSLSCQHLPQNNSLESRFFWYVTPFSPVRSCNIRTECTDSSFKLEKKAKAVVFSEKIIPIYKTTWRH